MAKAHEAWKVLRHRPIEKLAENLWFVSGSLPGMSLRRTMVVARRPSGDLVIHNAIALDDASMAELEAWGRPALLVVPCGIHRLDAKIYKQRYPQLRVVVPPGARKKVEEVVPVDATYDDPDVSTSDVRFETLSGLAEQEGAMIVRSEDGVTVVLNDAMFNMDLPKDLVGKVILSALGSAPGPRVSRLAKLALVKDKKALRGAFERYAAMPDLVRLVVAHDKVASGSAARDALQTAATFL